MSAVSSVDYIADGSTDEFDVTFPFLDRNHVKVTVNGVPPILPVSWVGEARVKLNTVLIPGSVVTIKRQTPLTTRLVDFTNGSVLTEEELDKAILQIFYLQQENQDLYNGALNTALVNLATQNGLTQIPAEGVLDELAAEAIARASLERLRQAIADVDLNANTISQVDARIEAVEDLVDALSGGETGISTLVAQETQARIDGDNAIVTDLSLLGAKSGDNLSWILDLDTVKVSPSESMGTRLSAINAATAANQAAILNEETVRADADTALATSIASLWAQVNENEAAISFEATARATADDALADARLALEARVGNNEADIVTEKSVRAAADSALSSTIALLGAKNAGATAFILDSSKVFVNATTSLGTRLSGIDSAVAGASAAIVTEQTARTQADAALTTQINALSARTTTAEATLANEQIARAAGDNALAQNITLLGTKNSNGTAFILNTGTVRISTTETLATRLNTISSSLGSNTNSISEIISSIDGIEGRYAISIDQGENAVAGFELIGGSGVSSTFRILADKFELVTPGTGTKPFRVENGVTYIESAVIKNGTMSDIGTYFANLNGYRYVGTKYVWYDLKDYYNNFVKATVNAGGNAGTKCVIDFTWVAARDGSDDDDLGLRIRRSDGYVLPQVLTNVQIDNNKRTYTAKFFDSNVPATGDYSYQVQWQSQGDGWSYWYNVGLTAILFKK